MTRQNSFTIAISLFALLFTVTTVHASENNVAKVLIMRGMVKAKLSDGSVIDVKVDQSIPEGAVLQTAEKSFVKLIFIDKSQMNLGPNSQMVINAFPKKEAGIITLVKGQIRSQVTKDYMDMDDKNKSKLYIKTKTAAMGIRGTDFQVNFNAENQNTALITFEGKVAMAHIASGEREAKFDQGSLERVVSSDKAVMVTQGQISAVNLNVAERAMEPTKLGTKQIEALEKNETGLKETSAGEESSKQFRNPIPPGADGAAFSNTSSELDKEIAKVAGSDIAAAVKTQPAATAEKGDAKGFFNEQTGEYKLPAGSIVDLNTVNIIPPPENAVFDPNSNTYVVPETYGKIDKITGEYKAPEGLQLGADGKFVLVDAEAYQKAQDPSTASEEKKADESKSEEKKEDKKEEKKDDKKDEAKTSDAKATTNPDGSKDVAKTESKEDTARAPASAGPVAPPVKIEIPKIYDARPEMASFTMKFAASPIAPPPPPPVNNTMLQNLAAETLKESETIRQDASNLGTISPTTRTKFIFNQVD